MHKRSEYHRIGRAAADIFTREVDWPMDWDWRNLLSGYIQIEAEDPEETIDGIIGMSHQIAAEDTRKLMMDERREAREKKDIKTVKAIDAARDWIKFTLRTAIDIDSPEFEAGVRAWVLEYIEQYY